MFIKNSKILITLDAMKIGAKQRNQDARSKTCYQCDEFNDSILENSRGHHWAMKENPILVAIIVEREHS